MLITVCTLNLWCQNRWAERRQALCGFLVRYQPDLLALQELQPTTRDTIDLALVEHKRVEDNYPGWSEKGNLYRNGHLFSYVDHGAEDFGAVWSLQSA